MKEYEVRVIEEKIVCVEADSEDEAIMLASLEAVHEDPESIDCQILSAVDLDEMDMTICGEHGCDGCLYHLCHDIEVCKQEAARKNKTTF